MRLFIFLSIFLTLYGGMHLYGFLKARQAVTLGAPASIALALFMGIMVFTPIIVRVTEKFGYESFARFLAYFGFTWMGFLFLFVSVSLAIDILRISLTILDLALRKGWFSAILSHKSSFLISLLAAMTALTYGYFEALQIRTEHFTIQTPKIPEGVGRLRIVQISDVHLGLIVRQGRLKRILNRVRAAEPDILVATGDLVDGQIDDLSEFAQPFLKIDPKHGKFAVTGNHEFYAGLERSLSFMEQAGFKVLRGEGIHVAGILNIAGVDDPAGSRRSLAGEVSEREVLSRVTPEKFTVLLKHRPVVDHSAAELFDLQLSGHTHRGQIFPFNFVTRLHYPAGTGLVRLQDSKYLYVSRGSGTWGPPIRFLAPPEVTVIDLVHPGRHVQNNP